MIFIPFNAITLTIVHATKDIDSLNAFQYIEFYHIMVKFPTFIFFSSSKYVLAKDSKRAQKEEKNSTHFYRCETLHFIKSTHRHWQALMFARH